MSSVFLELDKFVVHNLGKGSRFLAMTSLSLIGLCAAVKHKFVKSIHETENICDVSSPYTLFWLRIAFGRTRSRLMGSLMNTPLPVPVREKVLKALIWLGGIDQEEIRYPICSYDCIGNFFARTLKDNQREIEDLSPHAICSPCDGTIAHVGEIVAERVTQVKGATYNARAFLGTSPEPLKNETNRMVYVVIHLAPHHYHHFHAPVSFQQTARRHIPGETLPVFGGFLRRFNDIFSVQERVVLSGQWLHGAFHMAAVAACNVGNIRLDTEPALRTNNYRVVLRHLGGDIDLKVSRDTPINYDVGAHVGEFRLGSTIVLIFETPEDFRFNIKSGDSVKTGKRLGGVGSPILAKSLDSRKFAHY